MEEGRKRNDGNDQIKEKFIRQYTENLLDQQRQQVNDNVRSLYSGILDDEDREFEFISQKSALSKRIPSERMRLLARKFDSDKHEEGLINVNIREKKDVKVKKLD